MRKVWKKVAGFTLAVCTLASACVGSATSVDGTEEATLIVDKKELIEIQPMANYVQLDTKITAAGASWTQPWGYSSYRIWVDNTTNQTMTVTITSVLEDTHVFSVFPKSGKTYTINEASYGKHSIDFQTNNGVVSGTVRVRVANEALS